MNKPRRKHILAAAVAAVSAILYLPALGNGFVNWDDNLYVYDNPAIRALDAGLLRWAFTTFDAGNWHPLTWLSHALDVALWGLSPRGHHLTSVILHGINVFLVVLLVFKLAEAWRQRSLQEGDGAFPDETGAMIAAGVTGLLFGIHPLHVESVAWVSERKDVLCALFFLLSLTAYADHARLPLREGASPFFRRPYLISLGCFVLALLSKPMAVSLPLVILILDWRPFGRIRSWRALSNAVTEKTPFFALSLMSVLATMAAQQNALWTVSPPFYARILVALKAFAVYLLKIVLPWPLLPLYPYDRGPADYFSAELAAALLLLGAAVLLSVRHVRKKMILAAFWCYYGATLLPVLGLVQVGNQSMADRYMYLPSLGPFLIIGLGAAQVWSGTGIPPFRTPRTRRFAALAAAAAAAALAVVTVNQEGYWKNSIILWSHVIEKEPGRIPLAYNNRGLAFRDAGLPDRAIQDFSSALTLHPKFIDAYINRGATYRSIGRWEQAVADYSAAIALKPTLYGAYMQRAAVLREAGWFDESAKDLSAAIDLNPFAPDAYLARGDLLLAAGNDGAAAADYRKACDLGSKEGCDGLRRGRAARGTGTVP